MLRNHVPSFLALALCSATSLTAQVAAPSCGQDNPSFKVKNVQTHTPIPAPQSGKALVVFVADDLRDRPGAVCLKCASTFRVGLDGSWLTAAHGFAHTYFAVDAGDHHLCVDSKPPALDPFVPLPAHLHLQLDPGKIYFVHALLHNSTGNSAPLLELNLLDPDEGAYLSGVSPESIVESRKP